MVWNSWASGGSDGRGAPIEWSLVPQRACKAGVDVRKYANLSPQHFLSRPGDWQCKTWSYKKPSYAVWQIRVYLCRDWCGVVGAAREGLQEPVNYSIVKYKLINVLCLSRPASDHRTPVLVVNLPARCHTFIYYWSYTTHLNDWKKILWKKCSGFVFHCWTR